MAATRSSHGAAAAAAAASLVDGYVSISLSGKDASERLLRECSASRMVHVARLLAIDGVDVDVRDSAGRTALMVGASHGVEPVVAALVDAGAGAGREPDVRAPSRCMVSAAPPRGRDVEIPSAERTTIDGRRRIERKPLAGRRGPRSRKDQRACS